MSQHEIRDMVETQAQEIAASLVAAKVYLPDKPDLQGDALRNHLAKTQVVALIAYIQKLGAYREVVKDASRPSPPTSIRTPTASRPPTSPPAALQPNPDPPCSNACSSKIGPLYVPIISFFIFAGVFVARDHPRPAHRQGRAQPPRLPATRRQL